MSLIAKITENENHEISNCRDILAQIGPLETLLGSVSYNDIDNVDGKTQQLRTSARVFKKMKFDLSNSALEKKEKKEEVKPEDVKQEQVRRPGSTLWTSEEKKMFFEALNEFGKDFESIHLNISTRLKKKGFGEELIKTKPQIRHFYYKTFHMLLNSLKFNEKIPKNAQELYTLINYGEMRRKIGTVPKKNWAKLNELIHNGSISLRIKGKTIRVKTPMCRALRRLNQLDEKYDDLKLPTRVLVDLRPKDMVSFLRVQSMAQNPRIRVAVALQRRLSSLITCINTRWKSSEAVVYDKAVVSTNVITKDCVPEQKEIDEKSLLMTPSLRLTPPHDANVELPSIDISEYFSGQSISLTSFEIRKGFRTREEIKKEETESATSKTDHKSPSKQNGEDLSKSENASSTGSVSKVVNDAVNTILSLKTQDPHNKCDTKNITPSTSTNSSKDISSEEKRSRIEQIRQGWTAENSASLTVGEIYLMFGSDCKVLLEYSWDTFPIKCHPEDKQENNLTNSLKKLLSLAKIQCLTKPETKCSCGHVCGSKSNTTHFKKPLATKVIKKQQVVQESVVEQKHNDRNASTSEQSTSDDFDDTNNSVVHLIHQRETLQRLNPRFRTRGRGRCRQFVVERKLIPNKSESKHQIVSMDLVPEEKKPIEPLSKLEESRNLLNNSEVPSMLLNDNHGRLIEDSVEKTFGGLLSDNPSSSNMSTGISRLLKENENQWINADVTDYSLSSLLGHLDCSSKTNQSMVCISNEDAQLAQDMDAQLHTLFIENSVDYTAKFADLAAQVVDKK